LRRRCIGYEQLDALGIDAPQILSANGKAVPVEELKDLYGDLSAVLQPVAIFRGGKLAAIGEPGDVDGDARQVLDDRPQEEMILRDLLDVATTRDHAHQTAHEGLVEVEGLAQIAHAWRPIRVGGEAWPDRPPDALLLG
jgi:hypothetical protein